MRVPQAAIHEFVSSRGQPLVQHQQIKIPFWKTNYLMLRLFTIEAFELIALAYNSFVSPTRLFDAGSCVHANCNPLFLAVAALTHRVCVYGNTPASNESK